MAVLYIWQTKQWRFSEQYRKVQCKTCFAITGEIQGTCRMKIYDELGVHSLTIRRWRIKLIFFYKIVNGLLPDLYLYTAKKMKFSIKDFLSKCDKIRRKLRIWSHLLRKSLMKNFIFYFVVLGLFYSKKLPCEISNSLQNRAHFIKNKIF